MTTNDIQIFSLDTITQEEKDFLVYMYGDDLSFIISQKPKEILWWIKAFQAVKAGKRPKFNWAAFFLASIWALRKKAFKLVIMLSVCFWTLLIGVVLLAVIKKSSNNIFTFYPDMFPLILLIFCVFTITYSNIISGFFGPSIIIKSYMKSNREIKSGRLPLAYVIVYCVFNISILTQFLQPIYALILMKFWLPVKKEKPSLPSSKEV